MVNRHNEEALTTASSCDYGMPKGFLSGALFGFHRAERKHSRPAPPPPPTALTDLA